MRRKLLTGVCVVLFGINSMVYSDDTTVTLDGNTSSSGFSIKDSSGTSIARFQGDGKVGIGTTSPGRILHVSHPTSATFLLQNTGVSSGNQTATIYTSGTDGSLNFGRFDDTGTTLTRTDINISATSGNVGIGTTNPGALLHVEGDIWGTRFTDKSNGSYYVDPYGDGGVSAILNGSVGIGTTNPGYTLHVAGGVCIGKDQNLHFDTSSGAANLGIYWLNSNGNMGIHYMGDTGRDQISVVDWNAPAERVVFYRNGNVSVGGNLTCVSLSQTSSRDVKKDISAISANEAMEALSVLDPVKFKYKTDATNEEHLGFIAEDVPDLVSIQGHKALSPMDITAVLTKVVQEQQKTIKMQQKQIEELKEMMNNVIQLASVK